MSEHYVVLTPKWVNDTGYIWEICCRCGKDFPKVGSATGAKQLAYLHLGVPSNIKENSNG